MAVRCAHFAPGVLLLLLSTVGCAHSAGRRAPIGPTPPDRVSAERLNGEGLALVEQSDFARRV